MKITVVSKKKFITDCVFWALVATLVFLFFKYVFDWFAPFLVGFVLAALANHFAKKLVTRFKLPRKIGSTLLNLFFLVLIAALIWFIGYEVYKQIAKFVTDRIINGDLISQITATVTALAAKIPSNFQDDVISVLKSSLTSVTSLATNFISKAVAATPGVFIGTVVAIVASFIFCGDFPRITEFLKLQLPQKVQDMLPTLRDSMKNSILKLIKAYMIIVAVTFAELSVGLLILGEPYAFAIAAITAFIDILPIFGTGFVLWPWTVLSLINGKYILAIGLVVIYLVIQIVRQIIEPRLVGHSIGLHPIVTIIAMYVGSRIIGVLGIFLFPVAIIVIKNLQDNGFIELWKTPPKAEKEPGRIMKRLRKNKIKEKEDGKA